MARRIKPESSDDEIKLSTDRQEIFCREYARCLNATEAAKRAGYSEDTAYSIGSRLLKQKEIRDRLFELVDLTPEKIINEVACIAMAQFTDVAEFDSQGLYITPSNQLSKKTKAAIKSVKFTEKEFDGNFTRTVEVHFHDKISALEKLCKAFKIYPSEIKLIEAVNLLLSEGVLSEQQAIIVRDGVRSITDKLRKNDE